MTPPAVPLGCDCRPRSEPSASSRDPEAEPNWPFTLDLDMPSPQHTIRLGPGIFARVFCDVCGRRFSASGPTGYLDLRPICDLCMLEREPALGMLLALAAVTRSYGLAKPEGPQQSCQVAFELLAFAKIYERFAERYGPPRSLLDLEGGPPRR
ncbi:MAG: hypothetical protein AAGD06_04590 [Acidobacteriota bacterium]